MYNTIDNTEDVIDSRDIIDRIAELESDIEDAEPDADLTNERKELAALTALADEAKDYASDWQYGEILIRDSYFEDYAQGLARDIGAINDNASWPHNCIDWEQASRELQVDYTAVDFDGVTYWTR